MIFDLLNINGLTLFCFYKIIFIINGYFYAEIIPAVILGVFIGAQIGARVNKIINKKLLSNVFSIVVIYIAIRMLFKGLEINLV